MLHSKNKRVIKRSLITGGFVEHLCGLTHHVVSVGALAEGSKHSNCRNGLSGQPSALFWHSEAAERKKWSRSFHYKPSFAPLWIMDMRTAQGYEKRETFEAGDVTAAVVTIRGQRFCWPRWVQMCWGGMDVDGTTSPTNEQTVFRGHPMTAPMHKWEGAITYFQGSPNQFLSEGIFP